jgi:DNA-binding transcriptional LysR family regulator
MIDAGQLIPILESYTVKGHDISVVFRQSKNLPPKMRVFIDFLSEIFQKFP